MHFESFQRSHTNLGIWSHSTILEALCELYRTLVDVYTKHKHKLNTSDFQEIKRMCSVADEIVTVAAVWVVLLHVMLAVVVVVASVTTEEEDGVVQMVAKVCFGGAHVRGSQIRGYDKYFEEHIARGKRLVMQQGLGKECDKPRRCVSPNYGNKIPPGFLLMQTLRRRQMKSSGKKSMNKIPLDFHLGR